MVPAGFMNMAHRGASAYAPENTFSASDKASSLGVDQVELDVPFSGDGHIVVIHDDSLDRTTNGSGPVSAYSLNQLPALDAGSWFAPEYTGERIPPLGEVLEPYRGRLYLHIEIKGSGRCRLPLTASPRWSDPRCPTDLRAMTALSVTGSGGS